jgi:haloalkane dehalogenase
MKSQFIEIDGSKIHYLEEGAGDPVLFLHGMPTSSYIWRNVIPRVSPLARCIAPDLIGTGKSDKPDIAYTVADHIRYIGKFITALNLKRVTFVLHGWGSVIGLSYAMDHQVDCKGLVFYEAYLRPMNGEHTSLPYQEQILELQNSENIADLVTNGSYFIDKILPQTLMRPLPEKDMAEYREPFLQLNSGKALHQYIHEITNAQGETAVDALIADYSKKLTQSKVPKLMLYSVPGFITTMATVMWAKENLPNIELIEIGEDLHYAQETNPTLMGETISVWLQGVEQSRK